MYFREDFFALQAKSHACFIAGGFLSYTLYGYHKLEENIAGNFHQEGGKMSILTDFFIATPEEVDVLRVEQSLRDPVPTLEMNNVDSSKIEILARIIVEKPQGKMIALVKGASGEKFVPVDEL